MEDNPIVAGEVTCLAASDGHASFEPLLRFDPLRLRPLWVGIAMLIAGFFLFATAAQSADAETSRRLAESCAFPMFVYYFMVVHRTVRVLRSQPGWSVRYTPAAAVWKHFIPFYGVYFLYRWPRDVESYINWRLGTNSRAGLWTFLGILMGFSLRFFDSFVGWTIVTLSLYILYVPLRRALAVVVPVEVSAPDYGGTLGLR